MSLVFGPVPSRRLGRSLGINNIPPKECTYACVYCQLGNTIKLEVERREFYSPDDLVSAVEKQLRSLDNKSDKIDYLTFVPDGEPTLDLLFTDNIKALKKFGIKKVMLMSMFAWVLRFGLFGIGSPAGIGLGFLILSMIIYGMAFDFFNISGSLFVEMEAEPKIRASAQGLFMIMTNGFGAMIGAYGSGVIIEIYTQNGLRNWQDIWFIFAAYALVIGISFMLLFKYKHDPKAIQNVHH